jgi:hypothetical protein
VSSDRDLRAVVDRYTPAVIAAYHSLEGPPPLAEVCALLVQSGDEAAVIVCRTDAVGEAVRLASGGWDWPEFAEYASERVRLQPAAGLLRVVVACDAGMGQVRLSVLPGSAS